MRKHLTYFFSLIFVVLLSITGLVYHANAQSFIHPGGLHNQADLDRMKAKVAAGAHPWIDDWNKLITDAQAQNTYKAKATANMGSSRQQADADAHAAYLNALRWYISGDTTYAACAVRICNAWSSTVNQIPTGTDIPGLSGIPVFDFAMVGELLRVYNGWAPADFARFKSMMTNYFYPVCNNFLVNHNGACISSYWANWDACNIGAILTIGVLCDDTAKYNQAINYFKYGAGNGSLNNAIYYIHPGNLGQWQESGRDQEHAQLGVGLLGSVCQVAWNQGLDLYGYNNNRLLAGAEYVAQSNLSQPVPYQSYTNCDNVNQFYLSVNGLGRIDDRPVYELLYNHYVVLKGLSAPNTKAMAELQRPEHGSVDHFGYGTLTFTLDAAASPYPASAIPPVPTGLVATAGVSQVSLNWTVPATPTTQGYNILRSATNGGPYTSIASWNANTYPQYIDNSVTNGTTYYYVISAINQSGTSANSVQVSAKPIAAGPTLPTGWARKDIGTVAAAGNASYADVGNNTFIMSGSGTDVGGTADSHGYVFTSVTGDFTITARLSSATWVASGGKIGIVMRETLDANAKRLTINLGETGARLARFGTRSATGGNTTWQAGDQYTWVPVWFRLQRSGGTFTASQSPDGVTWYTMGSSTFAMANTFYAGLSVSAGSTSTTLSTATFDRVTVVGGGSAPAAPVNLNGAALSSSSIKLLWTASPGASGYSVKRALANGGPYTTIATSVTDTTYIDSGLVASTNYYYVVKSANVQGESADSVQTSVQTKALSLPPAPTGLKASTGSSRVILSWNPTDEATSSYQVRRATVVGGPYTVIASPATTGYADTTAAVGSTYFYTVNGVNVLGEGTLSAPVSILLGKKLAGTLTGTTGSYNNNPNSTRAAAMDGNLNTFFDAVPANGAWVGLDLGPDSVGMVTQVGFVPRSGYPQRMTGGVFQGANNADFSDAVTLSTVVVQPTAGVFTIQTVSDSRQYRYVRYLSPNNGYCNVAEVEFMGQKKRIQTITFNAISSKLAGDLDFEPGATASSGLPVSYSSSDTTVATIVNGKIHITGTGTSTIAASQGGNDGYVAAAPVSQTFTVTPLNLQVQYQDGDNGQLTNNVIRPYVKIVNADSIGVAYSELTMRYWFTAENYAGINTWVDYAQLGNNNINLKYVLLTQPRNGALGYMEYSFTAAGNLVAGSNTGPIQSRFANQDWSNLNEADDYSYQSNTSSSANNNHITLYRNGMLVWGTEPAVMPATTSLNVSYQNQNQSTGGNTISTYLAINNTGNVPVSFGDITARYWFTEDGTQSLNYWVDYAKKGTANINGNFVKISPVLNGADTYFEIAINAAAGTFYPLSSSGNIQYRIAKSDWSNFNELNDYSYLPKDIMKENNHITVYYKGQLLYGTEPSLGTMALKKSAVTVTSPLTVNNTEVAVHQGLSPNGDGINDFLIIDGLTAYPNNKLTIMNRNGVKVFEAKGYDNGSKVFDGHSNINGALQQSGTYYYSLEYQTGEGNKYKTGYIILKY